MAGTRIPLNLFGIAFGTTGLGGVWLAVAEHGHAPALVGDIILVCAALVWAGVLAAYLAHAVPSRTVVADLTDPVAAPFASLAVIVPMLLCAEGVYPHAASWGRPLVDVFLALTLVLGAWFTGQWIYTPVRLDAFHPGYFLPTVAGGLLAASSAAQVGQERLGEVMFGYGTVCWLILGSIIMGRLLFRPMLPAPLVPTLAIEVAPAAVASLAYFALHGEHVDSATAFLGGYAMLMVLAQLRLLPAYVRLPFMPSTWAFTFSWAAVATAGIDWLEDLRPTGYRVLEYLVLAAITVLVAAVAGRTVVALARRTLLLAPPSVPRPPADDTASAGQEVLRVHA